MKKVLFILKRKESYDATIDKHIGVTTGLYNSASFMNEMLVGADVNSKMVVVADNNAIDREVTLHRPTHVVIEALWVVPTKFAILQQLHPTVTWIVRLHSETPFIANEGMALDWVSEYANYKNVVIACNAPRILNELRFYLRLVAGWDAKKADEKVIYLPNHYPKVWISKPYAGNDKDYIDVGCFGAVRPLKNHLVQVFAALKFAEQIGKKLHFHINSGRLEMKGEPVLHNIQNIFLHLAESGHKLTSHEWTHRDDFLKLCGKMDIGMQVTFSETFNIVGADFVSQGVPVVCSSEIPWVAKQFSADPTSSDDITNKLVQTHTAPMYNVAQHRELINTYVDETQVIWVQYFKD
jgi:hypothetical protein